MFSRPASRASRAISRASTRVTADDDGEWIVACLEGRGVGREVGIAAIHKDSGVVFLTQFPDSPTFVKIQHLLASRRPATILVPATFFDSKRSNLQMLGTVTTGESTIMVQSLKQNFKDVPMESVTRKSWNEQKGLEFITNLIIDDETRTRTLVSVKSRFYALCAASALFTYLESLHLVAFLPQSLRIVYTPLQGTCLIDADTARNLELVANAINPNSKHHLLGLLNHTYTPMGYRLLRTSIMCPLTDTEVLNARLDVVEELLEAEGRFALLKKGLESMRAIDLDKLICQLVAKTKSKVFNGSDPTSSSEQKIVRILQLRKLLSSLSLFRNGLQASQSQLLKTINRIIQDEQVDILLDQINQTINIDAISGLEKGHLASRTARLYAVRSDTKRLLDVARETYKENVNDAISLGSSVSKDLEIDSLDVAWSGNGFVFRCDKVDVPGGRLGSKFTNINKKGKKLEFSCLDLKKLNARIEQSSTEIFLLSDEIIEDLISRITGNISCLYRIAEGIAILDMLVSFTDVSSKNNYVRPEWTDTLAIKAGRNPIEEKFGMALGSFVPNDTYASEAANFQLVGGANMSGKSTFLKQIALLYIMAQIGCPVPATYASFPIIHCILGRLDNNDSIEGNMSTFSKEMMAMSMILSSLQSVEEVTGSESTSSNNVRNKAQRCLLIIDELGRGTAPLEGMGIAFAIAEVIIKSSSICFFATHFKELAHTLGKKYPTVALLYLDSEVDRTDPNFSMTFHHRVRDGVLPVSHYGLELAKLSKLPSDVLSRSIEILNVLEETSQAKKNTTGRYKWLVRQAELKRLVSTLKDLKEAKNTTGNALIEMLKQVRAETLAQLAELNNEASDRCDVEM